MPTPREALFALLGIPIPELAVGSAVPGEAEPQDRPREAIGCRPVCECPPDPFLVADPDLLEELLEAEADRILFEEDC